MTTYQAQSARDAQTYGYGNERYWNYLDRSAQEKCEYFAARGDHEMAAQMMTRSLSAALAGNDGD